MLAQPWLGFDLMLSWFSAVPAAVPKAVTDSLAQGRFCLCWLLHQDVGVSTVKYIAAFVFLMVVFSLSPLSDVRSSLCATLFDFIRQMKSHKLCSGQVHLRPRHRRSLAESCHALSLTGRQGSKHNPKNPISGKLFLSSFPVTNHRPQQAFNLLT